jgi:hypothetical protein
MRISIFRTVITLLLLLVQFFFYKKISRYVTSTNKSPLVKKMCNIVFTVFNFPLIPLIIFRVQSDAIPSWFMYGGVIPFYIWHVSFLLSFLIWLIGYVISSPFRLGLWVANRFKGIREKIDNLKQKEKFISFDTKRRVFLQRGFTLLAGTTVAGTTYGAYSKNECEIVTQEIFLKNLPDAFDGFTISMLSDIHSSIFMTKEQMREYAALTNSLKSDVIVVTGDHVNSLVEEVYPFAEAFSELNAPFGVYGILGNHDYFTDNVDLVAKEIDDCGVRILINERHEITKDNSKLYLVGLDDTNSFKRAAAWLELTTKGCEDNIPKILLCHRPYFLQQAVEYNIDLTLSGHTHGGQIVIAKFGKNVFAPARIVSPYVAGLYSSGDSQLYVNRGIGTVGPPIRINCPPEITKIILRKKINT